MYMDFMKKRIIRIFPLYLLILTLTILYYCIYSPEIISGINIVLNASLLHIFFNGNRYLVFASWSLSAEMVMYILYPFFIKIYTNLPDKSLCLITIFSLISLYIISKIQPIYLLHGVKIQKIDWISPWYGVTAVIRCFANYIIGLGLFRMFEKKIKIKNNVILILTLSCLTSLIKREYYVITIFLSIFLIYGLTEKNTFSRFCASKIIYFLGKISYSIYLWHLLVFYSMGQYFKPLSLTDYVEFYLTCLAITILLSYITYELIEYKLSIYLRNFK